jgi:hypothetical protein
MQIALRLLVNGCYAFAIMDLWVRNAAVFLLIPEQLLSIALRQIPRAQPLMLQHEMVAKCVAVAMQ